MTSFSSISRAAMESLQVRVSHRLERETDRRTRLWSSNAAFALQCSARCIPSSSSAIQTSQLALHQHDSEWLNNRASHIVCA
jgi:7-keto-8-aminopelargonate synthetase-like enzyme